MIAEELAQMNHTMADNTPLPDMNEPLNDVVHNMNEPMNTVQEGTHIIQANPNNFFFPDL